MVQLRSWEGGSERMSDDAVINHCLMLLENVSPEGHRTCSYKCVIAVAYVSQTVDRAAPFFPNWQLNEVQSWLLPVDGAPASPQLPQDVLILDTQDKIAESISLETFCGELRGHILSVPCHKRWPGFPMSSLFFVDDYDLLLGHVYDLPPPIRPPTHRHLALEKVIDSLLQRFWT